MPRDADQRFSREIKKARREFGDENILHNSEVQEARTGAFVFLEDDLDHFRVRGYIDSRDHLKVVGFGDIPEHGSVVTVEVTSRAG